MHHSILVPLDGSEFAEQALPMALSLARRSGAAVHLARVYVPVAGVHGEHAMAYDAVLDRELMKRAQEYLDQTVQRITADGQIRASSALLEGPIADTLAQHATAVAADVIVMTTQGRGPLARFWLGSVSDQLVRRAVTPILFVRPQEAAPSADPTIRRVLVPLDGSCLAESILEPALALAEGSPTEFTLLRVITPVAELNYGPAGGDITGFQESLRQLQGMEKERSSRVEAYLERQADRLRSGSFTVKTRVAWSERPAAAILEDAAAHDIDLIALATHGHGGLRRLLLGSVADKVLRGASTAVLTYRPAGDGAGE